MRSYIKQFHILLIEDNVDHAELIEQLLLSDSKGKERITVIKDGGDAMEYLDRVGKKPDGADTAMPDLIFLDLQLPRVSGFKILARIKSEERLRAIPVVVLTRRG